MALRDPELGEFSAAEIDLLRDVIDELRPLTARQVSDLSHQFVGWQVVQEGEDIPYETIFVGEKRELSQDEQRWALQVLEDLEVGGGETAPFDP